jgi:energy-coupling factor transport system ATP-binding protein
MILVEDLWFTYGEDFILKNINLEIGKGEFIAIMGDNGAGKTTLVKHFNGLLKPSKGKVIVDDLDTSKASIYDLSRKVALVFQYPEKMFFSETVWDEVNFALKNFGFDEDYRIHRINKVLALLWLDGLKDRSPFTLSGGEQRRLALACALAWDPDYIVLDEPTAGQDKYQREILTKIIQVLVEQEKSVIIVTHDIEFVAELKPRVVLMYNGEIVADGAAEDILSNEKLLRSSGLYPPSIIDVSRPLFDKGIIKKPIINIHDFIAALEMLARG